MVPRRKLGFPLWYCLLLHSVKPEGAQIGEWAKVVGRAFAALILGKARCQNLGKFVPMECGFEARKKAKDGRVYEQWLSPQAWEARKARQTDWAKNNRESIKQDPEALQVSRDYARAHMKSSRRKKPLLHMFIRARARSKARGLEFSLMPGDVSIPEVCPVLGIPLRVADGIADDSSPELDRIDNEKGYVRGNVIVISRRANRIKNDSTLEELKRVVAFYEGLLALELEG